MVHGQEEEEKGFLLDDKREGSWGLAGLGIGLGKELEGRGDGEGVKEGGVRKVRTSALDLLFMLAHFVGVESLVLGSVFGACAISAIRNRVSSFLSRALDVGGRELTFVFT